MSDQKVVLVESTDGVALVTLNRPESRNAMSSALKQALWDTMLEVEADDSIAAVILTGADPAFCAGLDLKELSGGGAAEAQLLDPTPPWRQLTKPVIGAINGVAITGGFELALNCDFLVASERARFADTHTRVGVLPGWGLSVLLPQRVGFAMARRLSFTGNFLDAQQALQAGLVTEIVSHHDLLPRCQELAAAVVSNNQPAVKALLASYRKIEAAAAGDGGAIEAETHRDWMRDGGTRGMSDRVAGVFRRGRSQLSS
jgi:enoyl-CoA hydratase